MADAFKGITKTGICDSCAQEKVLTATPHHQPNNPKLWWYCEVCKFAHDTEKGVQGLLRTLAGQNAAAAEDPNVIAQLREQVATKILVDKAKNEALAPNEQLVTAPTEPAPATIPTPETVPSETPAA